MSEMEIKSMLLCRDPLVDNGQESSFFSTTSITFSSTHTGRTAVHGCTRSIPCAPCHQGAQPGLGALSLHKCGYACP